MTDAYRAEVEREATRICAELRAGRTSSLTHAASAARFGDDVMRAVGRMLRGESWIDVDPH